MPPPARSSSGGGGDSIAAGQARQQLKLAAIGYVSARDGIDAAPELALAGFSFLCQKALEFVATISGGTLKKRRMDLQQGADEELRIAAIAYVHARHGIDADVGMIREGLALLCQAAVHYVESLPNEEYSKRSSGASLQLSKGGN